MFQRLCCVSPLLELNWWLSGRYLIKWGTCYKDQAWDFSTDIHRFWNSGVKKSISVFVTVWVLNRVEKKIYIYLIVFCLFVFYRKFYSRNALKQLCLIPEIPKVPTVGGAPPARSLRSLHSRSIRSLAKLSSSFFQIFPVSSLKDGNFCFC